MSLSRLSSTPRHTYGTKSAGAPTTLVPNMVFCYSVRLYVSAYTGAVMNVQRSTDNTSADFYTDATQSFLNTSGGVSMTTWLSGGTGNVNTLYDQTGLGNHAINGTKTALTLYNGKYIILSSNANQTVMTMTTAVSPTNLSLLFQFSDTGGSNWHTIISTTQDDSIRVHQTGSSTLYGDNYNNDFLYNNTGVVNYVNNVSTNTVTFSTNATPVFNTCAITISNVNWKYGNTASLSSGFNTLFSCPAFSAYRCMDGYFTEIIGYNSVQTTTVLQNYYTNKLL